MGKTNKLDQMDLVFERICKRTISATKSSDRMLESVRTSIRVDLAGN